MREGRLVSFRELAREREKGRDTGGNPFFSDAQSRRELSWFTASESGVHRAGP